MNSNKKVILGSAQTYIGLVPGASHYRGVLTDSKTTRDDLSPRCNSEEMALQWCYEAWMAGRNPGGKYHNTILMLGAKGGDWCAL